MIKVRIPYGLLSFMRRIIADHKRYFKIDSCVFPFLVLTPPHKCNTPNFSFIYEIAHFLSVFFPTICALKISSFFMQSISSVCCFTKPFQLVNSLAMVEWVNEDTCNFKGQWQLTTLKLSMHSKRELRSSVCLFVCSFVFFDFYFKQTVFTPNSVFKDETTANRSKT